MLPRSIIRVVIISSRHAVVANRKEKVSSEKGPDDRTTSTRLIRLNDPPCLPAKLCEPRVYGNSACMCYIQAIIINAA